MLVPSYGDWRLGPSPPLEIWRLGGECIAFVTVDGDMEIRGIPVGNWRVGGEREDRVTL